MSKKLFIHKNKKLSLNPAAVSYYYQTFGILPEILSGYVENRLNEMDVVEKLRFVASELANPIPQDRRTLTYEEFLEKLNESNNN